MQGRALHRYFGPGLILSDRTGTCHVGEVIFKPDQPGLMGRNTASYNSTNGAFNETATFDIVNVSDLSQAFDKSFINKLKFLGN